MATIIIFLFILVLILTIVKFEYRINAMLFSFFLCVLIPLAGFRGAQVDRDYMNYVKIFENYKTYEVEPTFYFIAKIIKEYLGGNVLILFLVYAIIGVSLKLYAIRKLTRLWMLSLLVYLSYYFILHDLTQIRAGVAAALLLLAIEPIRNKDFFAFIVIATLAILFHYSAIIILPFWFLGHDKISKIIYYLIIPATYLLYFLKVQLILAIPIESIRTKVELYQLLQLHDQDNTWDTINVFNLFFVARVLIFYFFLFNIDKIQKENQNAILLVKIYGFSLACFVALATMPIMAFRINELLGVVEIILIPMFLYIIPVKAIAKSIVYVVSSAFLFLLLFYNKIIT
jgi:hypothetical protein